MMTHIDFVEEVLKELHDGMRILDLCTGSGCVPISVLLQRADIPAAYGVELYPSAEATAERNMAKFSEKLGDRFTLVHGDVLHGDVPAMASGDEALGGESDLNAQIVTHGDLQAGEITVVKEDHAQIGQRIGFPVGIFRYHFRHKLLQLELQKIPDYALGPQQIGMSGPGGVKTSGQILPGNTEAFQKILVYP